MKRVLITAVYYPPCELIGAKRPYKMATFLAESGWDVTVLTVHPELTPPIGQPMAASGAVKVIRTGAFVPYIALQNQFLTGRPKSDDVAHVMGSPEDAANRMRYGIKRWLTYLTRTVLTSFDRIDQWSGWRRRALRAMKSVGAAYDVVLSTMPPFSTAYLGMELAAHYKSKFVLDYRDPWTEQLAIEHSLGSCSSRKLARHAKFEERCLKSADLVLTVSPAISAMISRRVDKRILTIPQGFTGDLRARQYDKNERFILYAGSLSYGRDLSNVLSAVKHYSESYDERLKLCYFGPHSSIAYEQAKTVDSVDYIEIGGMVPESEVFECAQKSICNVVIISPGYEYTYPGKLFELITAGRPIYVISSIDSEAGKLVEEYKIGCAFTGNNFVDLADRIRSEIDRGFQLPGRIDELRVENIYERMLNDGLNRL